VRIANGLRRLSMRDELTGLLNYTGFLQIGEPYTQIIRSRQDAAACTILRVGNLAAIAELSGRHEQDWLLLELAECLRPLTPRLDIAAHCGDGSFSLLYAERERATVSVYLNQLPALLTAKARQQRGAAFDVQIQLGTAALDASTFWSLERAMELAEERLWENKPDPAPCPTEIPSLIQ
jgi:GGDEF domain-containing protein